MFFLFVVSSRFWLRKLAYVNWIGLSTIDWVFFWRGAFAPRECYHCWKNSFSHCLAVSSHASLSIQVGIFFPILSGSFNDSSANFCKARRTNSSPSGAVCVNRMILSALVIVLLLFIVFVVRFPSRLNQTTRSQLECQPLNEKTFLNFLVDSRHWIW